MTDFRFSPFQLAFILGIPFRDISKWIKDKRLRTNGNPKCPFVSRSDLVDFLGQNRDCVGQLYCDSSVPVYNELRQLIIEEMDAKWPIEQVR